MKKLSKKESIIECEKMWKWLSKNPNRSKKDYFASVKKLIHYSEFPVNECYACSYTSSPKEVMRCPKCYMLDLWLPGISFKEFEKASKKKHIFYGALCVRPNSPYKLWLASNTPVEKSKYAKKIAEYCTLLLRKEEK